MRHRRIPAIGLAIAAALLLAACGSSSSSTTKGSGSAGSSGSSGASSSGGKSTLNGAGSTLAAPIYTQWASTLSGQGVTLNYNPVGSGTGIADLQTATVDFAGSDPALKASDKTKMKGAVLQFPVAFGAITVSYNLSGIKSGIKLDGPTVAKIYMGQIKTWNDPAIKSLNPGMSLPSTSITVVHRSDSSGTTAGFTKFLADTDPAWKASIGSDKEVKWPTGTGAAKNSGVAAAVKQTAGAIGYVEQAYAIENNFTYAAVKNASGQYVLPTIQNTSAAANGIKIPPDLGISTINSPASGAYPIVSQTFLVAYKDPCKAGASSAVAGGIKKFLTYALGPGQQTLGGGSNQLPYAPLPSSLADKNNTQLGTMTCNGSAIS
ncbi:MAG: phosphate ABC transporter substrate-binding protein PstS [Solirubrobacterales bacterium]|nr:phosphate ABC transporter substrate-binding protein PstS [Solirubrobacterales bacterium]